VARRSGKERAPLCPHRLTDARLLWAHTREAFLTLKATVTCLRAADGCSTTPVARKASAVDR